MKNTREQKSKKHEVDSNYQELKEKLTTLRQARRQKKEELAAKYISPSPESSIEFFPHPSFFNSQILLSTMWIFNGFVINLGKLRMLVDPAAELLSRVPSVESLMGLNTLFISHSHVDHYAGAEIALELMRIPSKKKQIQIIASHRAFRDKVINNYHAGIIPGFGSIERITLRHKQPFKLYDVSFTPIKLYHSISGTFGFIIEYKDIKIGYISDTGYTKVFKTTTGTAYKAGEGTYKGDFAEILSKHAWIKKHFAQVDYLIANINDLLFNKHSQYHLTGFDLIDILKGSRVKQCFLQHIHPIDLLGIDSALLTAQYITEKSGVSVSAIPAIGLKIQLPTDSALIKNIA